MGERGGVLGLSLEGSATAADCPKREVRGASERSRGSGHCSHRGIVDIMMLMTAIVGVRELALVPPSLESRCRVLAEEVGGCGLTTGIAGILGERGAQARRDRGALSIGVGCVQAAAGVSCVLGEGGPTTIGGDGGGARAAACRQAAILEALQSI